MVYINVKGETGSVISNVPKISPRNKKADLNFEMEYLTRQKTRNGKNQQQQQIHHFAVCPYHFLSVRPSIYSFVLYIYSMIVIIVIGFISINIFVLEKLCFIMAHKNVIKHG